MSDGIIKVGPGPEALPPAGYRRREALRKRADHLAKVAEAKLAATDLPTYRADPNKLKEEPEILQHLKRHPTLGTYMFKVKNPKPGYVYFWCRNNDLDVSVKESEAAMWGVDDDAWQIVANGPEFTEAAGTLTPEGYRKIGDVILMRIKLASYEKIQKRIMLANAYHEANIPQALSDFIAENEGLVKVVSGNEDPQVLYQKLNTGGGRLGRGVGRVGAFD